MECVYCNKIDQCHTVAERFFLVTVGCSYFCASRFAVTLFLLFRFRTLPFALRRPPVCTSARHLTSRFAVSQFAVRRSQIGGSHFRTLYFAVCSSVFFPPPAPGTSVLRTSFAVCSSKVFHPSALGTSALRQGRSQDFRKGGANLLV